MDQQQEPVRHPGSAAWLRLARFAAAGAIAGAALIGAVASVSATTSHSMHVIVHATSFKSTQVDPTGYVYAPGDQVSIGFTVLDFDAPHKQVGTVGLFCVATGADGSALLCDAAFTLSSGKISLQSLFDVKTEWLNPVRHLAIIGGTGDYLGARGETTVHRLSSGDETITFNFS